jgi:hypothetical protein
MDAKNRDPEPAAAGLAQEATNQSTPVKSLEDSKARNSRKRKTAVHRSKPPAQ